MIELLTHTPVYVWFLLGYLIWTGVRGLKTRTVTWTVLTLMPAALFLVSLYTNLTQGTPLLWALFLCLGIGLGAVGFRRSPVKFQNQHIELPGSWLPLLLSLTIFSLRYFLGATYGLHPELKGTEELQPLENLATLVSGLFLGRLLGYWLKLKEGTYGPNFSHK